VPVIENRPSLVRSEASIEFGLDGNNLQLTVADEQLQFRFAQDFRGPVPARAHQDFRVDPGAPEWGKETARLECERNIWGEGD
jgi:hypothetical protein